MAGFGIGCSLATAAAALSLLGIAACAPEQAARPAVAAPASQMSLGGSATPARGGSAAATQGHDMSSMDMQAMMAHCAEIRRQLRAGAAMTPDMRRMVAQCDEMDRAHHGAAAPRR